MYITSIVTIYYNIIWYNHIISYIYIHKQRLWFLWAWFWIQFPLSMVFLISRNLTSAEPLKFLRLWVELWPICYSAMPSDGPQKRRFETTAAESTKSSTGRVILVTGTAGFVGFLVWIETWNWNTKKQMGVGRWWAQSLCLPFFCVDVWFSGSKQHMPKWFKNRWVLQKST